MGKGGQGQVTQRGRTVGTVQSENGAPVEVLIEGRLYDVSNMKHPGGSVIKFYAGKDIDATQAFANFHV